MNARIGTDGVFGSEQDVDQLIQYQSLIYSSALDCLFKHCFDIGPMQSQRQNVPPWVASTSRSINRILVFSSSFAPLRSIASRIRGMKNARIICIEPFSGSLPSSNKGYTLASSIMVVHPYQLS